METPKRRLLGVLRIVPTVMYCDESGRFLPLRSGEPDAPSVVGFVVMPDTQADRALLRHVVEPLRRLSGQRGAKRDRVERTVLSAAELLAAAESIPKGAGWLFHWHGTQLSREESAIAQDCIGAVWRSYADMLRDPRSGGSLDLRTAVPMEGLRRIIDDLESPNEAARTAATSTAGYLISCGSGIGNVCRWFLARGILPVIRVVADPRAKLAVSVMEYVGRFFYFSTFHAVLRGVLAAAAGTETSPTLNVGTVGDEDDDGVALADLYTSCCGAMARGQDPGGAAKGFVDGRGVAQ